MTSDLESRNNMSLYYFFFILVRPSIQSVMSGYLKICLTTVCPNWPTYLNLNTDVTQGSVLGPLPFSIYVNDISLCLDHDISHLMYADDLQVYIRCPFGGLDRVSSIMS